MPRRTQKIQAAMRLLRSRMVRGQPYNAADMLAEAQRAGFKERTTQIAAERLGVEKTRIRAPGRAGVARWQWVLPDDSDDPARASPALQLVSV